MDRFKYRYWQHKDWKDNTSPLEAVYCNIVDGCDPTVAVSNFEMSTGLKDKNGNLIYEGDVLKSIFSEEKLYEVVWCADCYKLRVLTKSSRKTLEYLGLKNTKTSYEVIGNIHEGVKNANK